MAYSKQYEDLAAQIAMEEFPNDPALAQAFYNMIKQESGFDSDVVEGRRSSSAGAQGIAQFMPATAREQGVNPLDPEAALHGAARYLRSLIAYFGGDVRKGVAAYNTGAGNLEGAIEAGGARWEDQLPSDETRRYLAAVFPQQEAAAGEAGGGNVRDKVIAWLVFYYGFGQADAEAEYESNPVTRTNAYYSWLDKQTEGGTEGPAQWEMPEAREAARLGNIETELGLGLAGYGISNDDYERQRGYYADQVEAGRLTLDQATNKFNAWMNATAEAGRRAEFTTNIKEERAKRTLPGEYFPLTEPGGMLSKVSEGYDLPFTPLRGTPVSSMPSPDAAYEQYRAQMGISAQAPTIPDVPVPNVPTPPAGAEKAREFVDALLRRRGIQTPALGY